MSGEGEGKLDMSGMEKVEALSAERFRNLRGIWYAIFILFTGLGIFLSINQIFSIKFFINFVILDNSYLYLMLGLFVSMVFLVFPATSRSPRDRIPWYDICLFLITISICIYYSATGRQNLNEGWEFWPIPEAITDGFLGWISLAVKDLFAGRLPDVIVLKFLGWISMAFAGWALVMETVRRTGGTAIFLIFGLFSLYPVYADAFFIPEIFSGRAQDLWSTARYHLMSEESVLGIPMTVFGTLIVGFIIFGVTLQSTGGGRFFINLAFALLGGVRGGPAKVAIVASGMFGSLSGSVITNVLTTGAMTIPAMKRTGYPARYAAGIEACASTGGVLMPPVMGATAFVMASFLDVSYLTVAAAAVIPSLLYFFGLFVQIDSFAARNQIKGLPAAELPSVGETLREGWYYVIAFLLLIVLLVYLKREAHAPFFATAALLALSQLGKLTFRDVWYWIIISAVMAFVAVVLVSVKFPPPWTTNAPVLAGIALLLFTQIPSQVRIGINDLYGYLFTNGKLLAELVSILAAVGLIIGGLMVTGMAGTFSGDLVRVAGGNMYLLLAMGALTSFILGIGMTVTAAYIFLAIVLAPGLVELGMDKVAVHLFILYWGMISFITPPVALGAYAAASLAGAKPMQTGFEAMRLGSIIYFLPFFFVLNPALIFHAPWLEVLMELVTALIGITLLASGLQGYLVGVGPLFLDWASAAARIFLIVGGLLLAYPEMISNGVGILLLVPAVLLGKLAGRDNLPAPEVSGTG